MPIQASCFALAVSHRFDDLLHTRALKILHLSSERGSLRFLICALAPPVHAETCSLFGSRPLFSFPATQLPLEVYPHRQPYRVAAAVALLELLDARSIFLHKAFISSGRSMSSWPTKSSFQASTRVAQSLLSRFHGRMSAASLGRSPSRLYSIGEFGSPSPRCRIENDRFLPWVLVLFQVLQHVSMPAARRIPEGILRTA
jgi:hypothetical protein